MDFTIREECKVTYFIEIGTDEGVISVFADKLGRTEEVARLIAAAPDLYKACELWERAIKHGQALTKDLGTEMLFGEAIELTKAALAKARPKE